MVLTLQLTMKIICYSKERLLTEINYKKVIYYSLRVKTGTDPDHVGMYIGNNKMIHMADSKQNIVISDLNSKPYYKDNYVGARRVLPTLLSANPATKGDKIVENAFNYKNKVTMSSTNNEASLRFTAPGYVDFVYRKSGVKLGTTNLKELMNVGTTVSRTNLKRVI